jgi:hypothetical protein
MRHKREENGDYQTPEAHSGSAKISMNVSRNDRDRIEDGTPKVGNGDRGEFSPMRIVRLF